MKPYLLIAALFLTTPVYAAKDEKPKMIEIKQDTPEILAEKLGWCDKGEPPAVKPGEIVIWYKRDANGKCAPVIKQGK